MAISRRLYPQVPAWRIVCIFRLFQTRQPLTASPRMVVGINRARVNHSTTSITRIPLLQCRQCQ